MAVLASGVHRNAFALAILFVAACARPSNDTVDAELASTARTPAEAPETPKGEPPSFDELAPRIGSTAPPLVLTNLDGDFVDLATRFGTRPTVLVFGSYS